MVAIEKEFKWTKFDQRLMTACLRLRSDDQQKMLNHATILCKQCKTLQLAESARFWLRSASVVKVSTF